MVSNSLKEQFNESVKFDDLEEVDLSDKFDLTAKFVARLLSISMTVGYVEHEDISDEVKDILSHAIRRLGDGLKCWHAHNKYRNAAVQEATKSIAKPSVYHHYCSENFRHEHVVPARAIFKYIKDRKITNEVEILEILKKFCITATITKEDDNELNRLKLQSIMPPGFYDEKDELFDNPFARYIVAGIKGSLVDGFKRA